MPPIDPYDLLKCLGVLLTPIGGIKSPSEVDRISRLMIRFSKKLVSKCIYIQILKATHPDLLQIYFRFLSNEGWVLLDAWLSDAIKTENKALLAEMLDLLALCPLHDDCFKQTSIAQMIQSVAQGNVDPGIRNAASQLWPRCFSAKPQEFTALSSHDTGLPEDIDLSIYAPDTTAPSSGDIFNHPNVQMADLNPTNINYPQYGNAYGMPDTNSAATAASSDTLSVVNSSSLPMQQDFGATNGNEVPQEPNPPSSIPTSQAVVQGSGSAAAIKAPAPETMTDSPKVSLKSIASPASSGLPVIKIVTKGGVPYVVKKDLVAETKPEMEKKVENDSKEKLKSNDKEKKKEKEKEREKDRKSSSSSKDTKRKSKDPKSRTDKDKKDKDESRSKEKSREKTKSSKEERGKDKEKKAKHEAVNKQAEKDRETLAALKAMSSGGVAKLSKIPRKKSEEKDKEKGKEKTAAETQPLDILDKLQRPKTVKTFNSKFRSTGLEDTTKPAAAAAAKVPAAGSTSPSGSLLDKKVKRPGSMDPGTSPLEKKPKVTGEKDDGAISAAVAAVMKKTAGDTKPGVKLISPRPRRFSCWLRITITWAAWILGICWK